MIGLQVAKHVRSRAQDPCFAPTGQPPPNGAPSQNVGAPSSAILARQPLSGPSWQPFGLFGHGPVREEQGRGRVWVGARGPIPPPPPAPFLAAQPTLLLLKAPEISALPPPLPANQPGTWRSRKSSSCRPRSGCARPRSSGRSAPQRPLASGRRAAGWRQRSSFLARGSPGQKQSWRRKGSWPGGARRAGGLSLPREEAAYRPPAASSSSRDLLEQLTEELGSARHQHQAARQEAQRQEQAAARMERALQGSREALRGLQQQVRRPGGGSQGQGRAPPGLSAGRVAAPRGSAPCTVLSAAGA